MICKSQSNHWAGKVLSVGKKLVLVCAWRAAGTVPRIHKNSSIHTIFLHISPQKGYNENCRENKSRKKQPQFKSADVNTQTSLNTTKQLLIYFPSYTFHSDFICYMLC